MNTVPSPTPALPSRAVPGSPARDTHRHPPTGEPLRLEDEAVEVGFDPVLGTLVLLRNRATGWSVQRRPELGQAFRAYVGRADQLYGPVDGARQKPTRIERGGDGRSLHFRWEGWTDALGRTHDVRLETSVELRAGELTFRGKVTNRSDHVVNTVAWPCLGDVGLPDGETTLTRENLDYGTLRRTPLRPHMANERGYYGTNHPVQWEGKGSRNPGVPGGYHFLQRFMLLASDRQGVYWGAHDATAAEMVAFACELRPGFGDSYHGTVPGSDEVAGVPVCLSVEAVHYPFLPPGESVEFSPVVLTPYQGGWQAGLDVYRRWRATWYQPAPAPAWLHPVHSWQQIQIGSSEDDLRTRFVDLPARAEALAAHGVTALQLVGWNHGGQDRGNPSHDPDPRLGTWEELRGAIAQIEALGVRVILFNKFVWADITRPDYRAMLPSAALDPYGQPYHHPGYEYQTPVQLMSINTRRFMAACLHDPAWVERCLREFQKCVDLGASGMLYDEAFHHYAATHCFSAGHGHRVPATLTSGDLRLGERLREAVRQGIGEANYLLSAEWPFDLQHRHYSLSYFRIFEGHIPAERYADPFYPMMIAVTGFDDREMVNRALLYRYIISHEPYHFKGDLEDYPRTLAYAKKVDALRSRYAHYLWHAEFRDKVGVALGGDAADGLDFALYRNPATGRRAVVVINDGRSERTVDVLVDGGKATAGAWFRVVPEEPEPVSTSLRTVPVSPRSAVVLCEGSDGG